MNPRRSPSILLRHELDQLSQTHVDRWAPLFPREAPPVAAECTAVPADDGRGLHNRQRRDPVRPQIPEGNPEQPINRAQPRPATLVDEGRELLSQGEILKHERAPRTREETDRPDGKLHQQEHRRRMWRSAADGKPERSLPEIRARSSYGEAQRIRETQPAPRGHAVRLSVGGRFALESRHGSRRGRHRRDPPLFPLLRLLQRSLPARPRRRRGGAGAGKVPPTVSPESGLRHLAHRRGTEIFGVYARGPLLSRESRD